MTADRFSDLIEHCMRVRRIENREAHYRDMARFFGVEPITLRRWLTGASAIPRQVEVILEIFHTWPEVTAEKVDAVIRSRDGRSRA